MSSQNTSQGDVYCTSCGEPIVEDAEMCPHCGASQPIQELIFGQSSGQQKPGSMNEMMEYDLQKMATKNKVVAVVLGVLLTPFAYGYVGKWGWAAINFITFNYLLLGFVIVPIHTWYMISTAEKKLDQAGVAYE